MHYDFEEEFTFRQLAGVSRAERRRLGTSEEALDLEFATVLGEVEEELKADTDTGIGLAEEGSASEVGGQRRGSAEDLSEGSRLCATLSK